MASFSVTSSTLSPSSQKKDYFSSFSNSLFHKTHKTTNSALSDRKKQPDFSESSRSFKNKTPSVNRASGIKADLFNDHEVKPVTSKTNRQSPTRVKTDRVEMIDVMSLLQSKFKEPVSKSLITRKFPHYESTKYSLKQSGLIAAYAANTNQGTVRNYNEDRVSIILNMGKNKGLPDEQKISFFGVYDGHGGNLCADFLRDHLHNFIANDSEFPTNPKQALINGFSAAEEYFINNYALDKDLVIKDRSGSCAVIALVVGEKVYIANTGDSRAVLIENSCSKVTQLTTDHKPNEVTETERIVSSGGSVYQFSYN